MMGRMRFGKRKVEKRPLHRAKSRQGWAAGDKVAWEGGRGSSWVLDQVGRVGGLIEFTEGVKSKAVTQSIDYR